MKNNIPLNRIQTALFVALLTIGMAGNVMGGSTFTAVTSGNWTTPGTWNSTTYPKSGDDVVIPASYKVTVNNSTCACNNLTLSSTGTTNLAIGSSNILAIYGTLNGPSTSFSNSIITTTSGGEIVFSGSTPRPLFGSNWSAAVGNWACEVALDAGITGTASTAIKLGCLLVTSGTFTVSNDLRIDVSGSSSIGNGGGTILINGNLLVTGNLGAQTTDIATYCNSITNNGKLTVEGDYLNASSITGTGTLVIKKTNSTGLISYPNTGTNFNFTGLLEYEAGTAGTIFTGAEISQAKTIKNVTIVSPLVVTLQSNAVMAGTLTINDGATLNVASGVGLTVNAAKLNSSQCLVLKTSTGARPVSASFIDNGIVDNTSGGTGMMMELPVTGHKTTKNDGRYWYVSSPVSNATSAALNIGTNNYLWYWDNSLLAYTRITNATTSLSPAGLGYSLICSADNVFNFVGTPNTDPISISGITRPVSTTSTRGLFLFGNPYPSSLDWSLVGTTNMNATITYRSANSSGVMCYDYWNSASGGTNNNQYGTVSSVIPPMQAVWVRVDADGNTGSISMDNTMRVHNTDATSNFLKSAVITPDRFKLALTGNGNSDNLIIVQADTAKDEMDRFDAIKWFMGVATQAEFCTLAPTGEKLAIEAVKPITAAKDFPLSITIGAAGNYKFTADLSQSYGTNKITLEDKVTDTIQDLSTSPNYTFSSGIVKDSVRFIVHFNPITATTTTTTTTTTATAISTDTGVTLQIYAYNGVIHINNAEIGSNVVVYDILGKTVYSGQINSDAETITSVKGGYYIAKVISKRSIKTQKVYLTK